MNYKDIDFSNPTRQSPVAIILLIWKYFINILRQFWPAIIAIFIGQRTNNYTDIIIGAVIILAASTFFFAIAYYFRFSFSVRNDELQIRKGVFKKTTLDIPFERIQTLNFEQSVIHQIFNVVKIEVDTAGSSKNEFTFNALDRSIAEELRTLILERKSELSGIASDVSGNLETDLNSVKEEEIKIFSLDFKDLFIIGISQNHLRTLVVIFFFLVWSVGELEDAGFNLDFINRENAEAVVRSGVVFLFALSIFSLLLIIMGTSVRMIIKYFDYAMYRSEKGFKIKSGLFNRLENAALDHKIQQIKWVNNPLKRLFRIHELQLKQASSIEVSAKKSIRIPGIKIDQIKSILKYILKLEIGYQDLKLYDISVHYLIRNIIYFGFLPWIIISFSLWYFLNNDLYLLILLMIPYMILTFYVAFKKWKYGINDHILYTHHGVFENKNNLVQLHKIQNVQISQSPYQSRRKLANIQLFTASGTLVIPYIPLERARILRDFLLYKVYSSKQEWY